MASKKNVTGRRAGRPRKVSFELVADGIRAGLTWKQIADRCQVSEMTIERTVRRARDELGQGWPMPGGPSGLTGPAKPTLAHIVPTDKVLHAPPASSPIHVLGDFALRRALLDEDVRLAAQTALKLLELGALKAEERTEAVDTMAQELRARIVELTKGAEPAEDE